jgi:hypothetical protein
MRMIAVAIPIGRAGAAMLASAGMTSMMARLARVARLQIARKASPKRTSQGQTDLDYRGLGALVHQYLMYRMEDRWCNRPKHHCARLGGASKPQ